MGPWNRPDGASIVPIRIAHSSTDPNQQHEFYTDVFSAELIWSIDTVDAHHFPTSTVFLSLPQTHIELQFISRPAASTFGDFTVETYEDLLEETHDSILLSPFCGTDRWMDNHYAYATWTIPGLLDSIHESLERRGTRYHAGKTDVEHVSVHTRAQLDEVGFTGNYTFGLWIIEPGGQSIQTGGIINDPEFSYYASAGSPQWCVWPCDHDLVAGTVDPSRIYGIDEFNARNGDIIERTKQKEGMIPAAVEGEAGNSEEGGEQNEEGIESLIEDENELNDNQMDNVETAVDLEKGLNAESMDHEVQMLEMEMSGQNHGDDDEEEMDKEEEEKIIDLDLNEEIIFEPQEEVVFNETMMEYVAVAILIVAVIGNIWLCIYAKYYGKSNDRQPYTPIRQ